MREFLLVSCPVLIWIITALQALFTVLAFRAFSKTRSILYLLAGLVGLGLFYDALILSLGGVMSEGGALRALSRARFVCHGALIPLIFPICAYALHAKGGWKKAVWLVTGVLIVLGVAEGFAVDLSLQRVAGIVRYSSGEVLVHAEPE